MACQMTFNSLGRAKESIIVAVMRKFILLIPLIYIMPAVWSSNQTMAVYLAEPIADALAVTFTAVLFAFQFKRLWERYLIPSLFNLSKSLSFSRESLCVIQIYRIIF